MLRSVFCFRAKDGIRGSHEGLEFRRVLFRSQVVPALQRYFGDIWAYSLPQIGDPLAGIELPDSVRKRMTYTGYLKRSLPKARPHIALEKIDDPFLLVTVGGGGDGEAIIDWVLRAYEADPQLPYPALLVLGPFMNSESDRQSVV